MIKSFITKTLKFEAFSPATSIATKIRFLVELVGACIAVGVVGLLYEGFKVGRELLLLKALSGKSATKTNAW